MAEEILFLVTEVHNFGGFFGGDTVTLSGRPWAANETDEADEETLTIDEAALANVAERHHVAAGMLLGLVMAGDRVEQATLVGAKQHAELRQAMGPVETAVPLSEPLVLSYHCEQCELWIVTDAGTVEPCRVCGATALAT